jgi:hypothetical protein
MLMRREMRCRSSSVAETEYSTSGDEREQISWEPQYTLLISKAAGSGWTEVDEFRVRVAPNHLHKPRPPSLASWNSLSRDHIMLRRSIFHLSFHMNHFMMELVPWEFSDSLVAVSVANASLSCTMGEKSQITRPQISIRKLDNVSEPHVSLRYFLS